MLGWFYVSSPSTSDIQKAQQADTTAVAQNNAAAQMRDTSVVSDTLMQAPPEHQIGPSQEQTPKMGMFATQQAVDTTYFTVNTPLYKVEFTNLGAGPAKFWLQKYKTWDNQPVQMIGDTTRSAYSLGFISTQNYNVETNHILFDRTTKGNSLQIAKDDSAKLVYTLPVANGKSLTYTYTFYGNNYNVNLAINFDGVAQEVSSRDIDFAWKPSLNFTEKQQKADAKDNSAYAYTGGELEQLILSDPGTKDKNFSGQVRWVSTRTKFFTQIIKPNQQTSGATLNGHIIGKKDEAGSYHNYSSVIHTRIPNNNVANFSLYLGPLRYHSLTKYDETAYGMVRIGYSILRFFSDPFVKYIVIPYFETVGNWLGNFGVAVIIFAILIKLVLYPLTKKSFQSTAAMKQLQPEMKALQDKYKEDPQKQQQELMKLYKKAKVNPLGGCLPMLFQLPILITLWEFVENSIILRQKSFLWVHDLSAPDVILHLPFTIPFFGDHVSGLVLLMVASMAVQMKVSGQGASGGAGGAQMKMLQYFMPVMMLFIFNNLSAGVNLYYVVYNVLSVGQQIMINKSMDQIEVIERVDKKLADKMKIQKKLEEKKKMKKA